MFFGEIFMCSLSPFLCVFWRNFYVLLVKFLFLFWRDFYVFFVAIFMYFLSTFLCVFADILNVFFVSRLRRTFHGSPILGFLAYKGVLDGKEKF